MLLSALSNADVLSRSFCLAQDPDTQSTISITGHFPKTTIVETTSVDAWQGLGLLLTANLEESGMQRPARAEGNCSRGPIRPMMERVGPGPQNPT